MFSITFIREFYRPLFSLFAVDWQCPNTFCQIMSKLIIATLSWHWKILFLFADSHWAAALAIGARSFDQSYLLFSFVLKLDQCTLALNFVLTNKSIKLLYSLLDLRWFFVLLTIWHMLNASKGKILKISTLTSSRLLLRPRREHSVVHELWQTAKLNHDGPEFTWLQ